MKKDRRSVAVPSKLIAAVTMMFGASTTAYASPSCLSRSTISAEGMAQSFATPLDRAITISDPDLPLRVALDRVAANSRVRLSYSADLLPPNRRVCLNLEGIPAGVALTELLKGTFLRPQVIDADNVVLTPSRGPTASEPVPDKLNTVSQLDRIVVTGTADGTKQRASAFALDVIERGSLMQTDASSLSTAFDGAVPGMWMWPQSPGSVVGRMSVRGASSFGVTSPKMYIDGIEVANPLVFTQFDPERIDRMEFIRGPQGAALYGADAISGVVNIITRHDGARAGDPLSSVRTRAGHSASDFATGGAFVQDHSFSVRAGTGRRSFGLGMTYGTVGNYIPGGAARSILGDGDVRFVGARTVFTGIARFASKDAGALASPLLSAGSLSTPPVLNTANNQAFAPHTSGSSDGGAVTVNSDSARIGRLQTAYGTDSARSAEGNQNVRQYTLGTTSTYMPNARWTHTLVAGVDGYRMNGVTTEGMPIPLRTDEVLARTAHSESDRTTLSARSIARFGSEDETSTTITFGAEHAATRQQLELQDEVRGGELSLSANSLGQRSSVWSNSAGVLAQVNSSLHNNLFLSAGGRVERTTGLVSGSKVSMLPMLGAAFVRERDGQSIKFRASYGKGIRPSNSALRAATWMSGQNAAFRNGASSLSLASLRNLEPEAQAGIEYGADVTFSEAFSVHVTRFDQRATGLIQAVGYPTAARILNHQPEQSIVYELQNVGAITNRGWELQGSSMVGRLALLANASFVDSRVQKVATRYGGELLPGDRMLEVPARTFSLQASYNTSRWSTSWTVARAMDWINYDQLRLAEQRAVPGFDSKMVTGLRLRDFWKEYNGATRLRGNASYAFSRGFSLVLTGDNLFNLQRGEPDNITVVPGRTLTAGIRTRF